MRYELQLEVGSGKWGVANESVCPVAIWLFMAAALVYQSKASTIELIAGLDGAST